MVTANVDLGIDTNLFMGPQQLSGAYPGRMAPATAANFVLLGSALALRDQTKSNSMSEYLALLCLFSGSVAILGYLYGVEALYRIKPYGSVALHTALLFVILPCGVLASRSSHSFMAPITSQLAGSVHARQILPWILGVPVVLGSLRLWGQIHGYYGTEFGLAISTASTIAILAAVVYLSARNLNTSDTIRRAGELEREALAAQLLQSQKLQAVGTLAGGIAHDFNNILMAISGNATLAQSKIAASHSAHNNILEIQKASARATDLVKRILAFSRPQQTRREPLLLQPIIEEALRLLRATIPSTISIRAVYEPTSESIMADATQVHQVLMNLGANAAFAMRDHGGVLEIKLEKLTVDSTQPRASPDLHAGSYERITVTDNGTGMDAAIVDRIFDPFFTTKGVGEGTGLGLSVSHGIMRAHGGAIVVTSELGKGSTFSLYFPAIAKSSDVSPGVEQAAPTSGRRERVLFVDDEESLVLLITRILEQQNYTVTSTTDPKAAVTIFAARPDEFDILVTDLAMPGMSGFELATELRKIRPNLPIVLTSGYVRPEDAAVAKDMGVNHLILKPDTVAELGTTLKQIFNPAQKS